jgi:hypothetical protein
VPILPFDLEADQPHFKDHVSEDVDELPNVGTMVGIVIAIVVLLALGAAAFFYLHKKHQRAVAAKEGKTSATFSVHKRPLQRSEVELQSIGVADMPFDGEVEEAGGLAKFGAFTLQQTPTAPIGQMRGRSESGHGDSFRPELGHGDSRGTGAFGRMGDMN